VTRHYDPPRPSELHHEAHTLAIKPSRLSHKLEYHPRKDRWVCKCGYELGQGHNKLYMPCPITRRPTQGTYHENKITAKPKLPKQGKEVLELFDFALKPRKKKGRKTKS
jgi:hypothetical protein